MRDRGQRHQRCRQIGRCYRRHTAQTGQSPRCGFLGHQLAENCGPRLTHRPGSSPDRQIGHEIVIAPAADAGRLVRTDVERAPAGGNRATEFPAVIQRERQIARRMTFATMRERLGRDRRPGSIRSPCRIRLEARIRIEQRRPARHSPSTGRMGTPACFQELRRTPAAGRTTSLHRQPIGVRQIAAGGLRHRRMEPRTGTACSAMNLVEKIPIAVVAEPGFLVGRES
jgi:hypothetical protein